jgi:hypothetical protein
MMSNVTWWTQAKVIALALMGACCLVGVTGCEGDDGGADLQAPAADLAGAWQAYATPDGGTDNLYFTMQLTQNGNNLAGQAGDDPLSGTISGMVVDLVITDTEEGYSTAVNGALNPDNFNQMAGTWSDKTGSGTWRARR